jgi:NAD(P)-dependent dehydrogenase (short-subunit alcohol dehydrogenase family)
MPVYVITGTNRGLGLEFVRQISASKDNTVIAAVRTLQNDLTDLKSVNQHNNIHILECDTGNIASIAKFGAEVERVLAGTKIDYLVNNSGINDTPEDSSLTMTPESLHRHIDINVLGPQKTAQVLVPLLAKDSVIVNMTSGLGSLNKSSTMEPRKCATYSVSKAALNMLTVHQAWDLRDKSRAVITMDPGWVKTRMGGAGAIMEPHDSIAGMLKIVHGLTKEDTCKFYESTGGQVMW